MKGDFSRQTFSPRKHYSAVLMQQGRVQLDADWNEQQAIGQHRVETGTADQVGTCGAPEGNAGFGITARDKTLFVGAGRYYVNGILCQNEAEVPYEDQPHPPDPDGLTGWTREGGAGLVYLDVWERHVTHLDDGSIREVALGGPDTTTRKQTVWQVKVLPLKLSDADKEQLLEYAKLLRSEDAREELEKVAPEVAGITGGLCAGALGGIGEPTGTLSVEVGEPDPATGRCVVPPGGGYERLENQLYRIEVHRGGIRSAATFKWSRDNGSVVTRILGLDGRRLSVGNTGRDEPSGFAPGQWVEVVDDATELRGKPYDLMRVTDVDEARNVVTVEQAPPPIALDLNPKLRRWDQQQGATEAGVRMRPGSQALEDGIEVRFSEGDYRSGDYWLVPARTATANVEWPRAENGEPAELPPHGVAHHRCVLAVVVAEEDELAVVSDCRRLFPPLTGLTSFFYAGGDGQEARPGRVLPNPLRVGVANGERPVPGVRIRFEVLAGGGSLEPAGVVLTGTDGIAECRWTLGTQGAQQVRAAVLDPGGQTVHPPIHFGASLSVAREVAYEPSPDCPPLAETSTVQEALDALCRLDRGGGGGCSVTVGDGGRFARLDEALKELAGERDVCICLLPGDHAVEGDLEVNAPGNFKIEGCGAGTRIMLEGSLSFGSLASFALKDVEVQGRGVDRPLVFNGCAEVALEGCRIAGFLEKAALLTVEGADRVRVEGCRLQALPRRLEMPVRVFEGINPDIAQLFADPLSEGEFREKALDVAGALSESGDRAVLARRVRAQVDRNINAINMGEELGSYRSFAEALESDLDPASLRHLLRRRLTGIRDAAARGSSRTALVLRDAEADANLTGNDFVGAIGLYGMPGEAQLNRTTFARNFRGGKITLTESAGTLRIQNNKLTRLAVSDSMIREMNGISGQGGKLAPVPVRSFLTGNVFFVIADNLLVTGHLAMAENAFGRINLDDESGPVDVGAMVANAAVFVGNHAPYQQTRLFDVSPNSQKAANLLLIEDA